MNSKIRTIGATLIVVFCFATLSASAQPLADKVPGEAILYIGWCGSESLPSQYKGSHLEGILTASNLPAVFNEMVPQLVARAGREDRTVGEKLNIVTGIAGAMWRHPTAIYFAGMDLSGREPMPRIGIICQAGNDTQAITDRITQFKSKIPKDAPINFATEGDTLVVTIGAPVSKASTLANSPEFKAAIAKVTPNQPAAVAYLDGKKLLALIEQGVELSKDQKLTEYWPKIREASGLAGLNGIVMTAGFDGKDWTDQLFVDAPAPRKGLLALCGDEPVSDDLLKVVPVTATYVSTGSFDIGALVERIRAMVGEVDKTAQQQVDRGLGIATMMVGKNFQKDVLDPLGSHWVSYVDPQTAGLGFAGFVLVNKLDDPKKAEQGITALAMFVSNSASSALQKEGFQLSVNQAKVGDVDVRYFGTPLISPAWAFRDGNLYLALYPQVAGSAARFASTPGAKSILDNPDFVALRTRLASAAGGNAKITSIRYMDLKKSALEGYQSTLVISRLALGFADMWGVKAPELIMPTLQDIMPHLSAAGAVTWSDDAGFHMKSVSPFPGSELLGGGGNMVAPLIGMQAMGAAVLLPSLGRARESANRVKCASNLRQLGQGAIMYANENKGKYPPDMATLALYMHNTMGPGAVGIFTCPAASEQIPPDVQNMAPEQFAAWANDNSPYVYVGTGLNAQAGPTQLVVYEKPGAHGNDGINMLFADGHVEFVAPMTRAQQMIDRSRR